MVLSLLLAVAAAAPAAQPPAAAPAIVEEVVAVVRNPAGSAPRAVTLTRLVEEARIVLASRGAVEAALHPIDEQMLRATLEWVLDQTVLADEAARLQVGEASREQVAAELDRFRARFRDSGGYARFLASTELSDEEVSAVLSRMLRVDRYLDTRVGRGMAADEEVLRYARDHGLSVESRGVREAVRTRLIEARVEAAVRELVAELRGRADIRVLDPGLRDRSSAPEAAP